MNGNGSTTAAQTAQPFGATAGQGQASGGGVNNGGVGNVGGDLPNGAATNAADNVGGMGGTSAATEQGGAQSHAAKGKEGAAGLAGYESAILELIGDQISKAQAKWEADRAEAERVKALPPDEQAKHEHEKRVKDVEQREQRVAAAERRSEVIKTFADKGLPPKLADLVDCSSAEGYKASAATAEAVLRECVELAVNARLKNNPPIGAGNSNGGAVKTFAEAIAASLSA